MKKFEINIFAQFCHNYCFEIDAKSKTTAIAKVKELVQSCGYQYCPGDEMVIEIDNIKELSK